MSLLIKIKRKLKKLKIPYSYVDLSNKQDKKIKIIINNKTIHFGAKSSITWIEGASEQKKNAYQARASKITNTQGEYTYLVKYTPNYLAYHVLWT